MAAQGGVWADCNGSRLGQRAQPALAPAETHSCLDAPEAGAAGSFSLSTPLQAAVLEHHALTACTGKSPPSKTLVH